MTTSHFTHFSCLFLITLSFGFLVSNTAAEVVIYWGQGNYDSEGSLRDLCNSGLYKIVNLGFLSTYGNWRAPQLNLAGHCDPRSGGCRGQSDDIKQCQNRGIKVLLSIGGGAGDYTLTSPDDARHLAEYLWNNFLGGWTDSRPLGYAVLDGIDFDIEAGQDYYCDLAGRLYELGQNGNGKKLYLTAAPQCPFPDQWVGNALNTGLFDYVWVQYYNNPQCEYKTYSPNDFKNSWNRWNSLPVKKVYIGLPASNDAADNGFISSQTLMSQVVPFARGYSKFGGIMLWDRQNDRKSGYSASFRGRV